MLSYLFQNTAKDNSVSPKIGDSSVYWRQEEGGKSQVRCENYSQGYSGPCQKFGGQEGLISSEKYRRQEGYIKHESRIGYSEGCSGSDGLNSGWRKDDWEGKNGDSRKGGFFRRSEEDFQPGAWTFFPPWPAHHNQGEQSHSTAIQC